MSCFQLRQWLCKNDDTKIDLSVGLGNTLPTSGGICIKYPSSVELGMRRVPITGISASLSQQGYRARDLPGVESTNRLQATEWVTQLESIHGEHGRPVDVDGRLAVWRIR